ncbi:MAG: type IV toxin-antitoxin system AbiEi family antitoxin domain-containing protein [Janthinobacterium lividum]
MPKIRHSFPQFDTRRLVEWQERGYLQRVVNRWYRFTEALVDEPLLWWTANRIYQPSYLSLETALSYHGLIPEGVYTLTSVSTRKTQTYATPLGEFSYQRLKPALYFGYEVLRPAGRPVLMANLEKALLDYCYLHPHLATAADFMALRFNAEMLLAQLNRRRLATYQVLFHHARLNQRIRVLLTTLEAHA